MNSVIITLQAITARVPQLAVVKELLRLVSVDMLPSTKSSTNLSLSSKRDKHSDYGSGSQTDSHEQNKDSDGKSDTLHKPETDEDDLPLSQVKKHMDKPGKKTWTKPVTHGIIKRKRAHKFSCTDYNYTGTSQGEISTHYLKKHGLLSCKDCGKSCRTISALRKHKY